MSFLFTSSSTFFEEEYDINGDPEPVNWFRSEFSLIGLNVNYALSNKSLINPFVSLGVQRLTFKTLNPGVSAQYSDMESGLVIPVGAGLTLNMSDRMWFDASLNYTLSQVDIDKTSEDELSKLKIKNIYPTLIRERGSGRPTKKERRTLKKYKLIN